MRIFVLLVTLLLMVPCQSCGWDDGGTAEDAPCEATCGSYRMDGEWKANLHAETWDVAEDGTISNHYEGDSVGILRVASTGCGSVIAGRIPGVATDDGILVETEYVEAFDDEGSYRYEWSWTGFCSLEQCILDAEVTIFNADYQQTQRGVFIFTDIVRRGSE